MRSLSTASRFLALSGLVLSAAFALLLYLYSTVGVGPGWSMQVYAHDLEGVATLLRDEQGQLYASLENNRGALVRVQPPDNSEVIYGGLVKPDGMLLHGGELFITSETGHDQLIAYSLATGQVRNVARLNNAEGIAVDAQGNLLVVEDLPEGRLLRIDPESGRQQVLLEGLQRAEGVCVGQPSGDIYLTEKLTGTVTRLHDNTRKVVVSGLNQPSSLTCGKDETVWISEDATNIGRLLLYRDQQLTTVASRLHSPQNILLEADGSVLISEQGRNRILRLELKQ